MDFGAVIRQNPSSVELGFCLDKGPGDDLLLHGLSHTTIGAAVFHFRVRDGIGWCHSAVVTRERVEGRRSFSGKSAQGCAGSCGGIRIRQRHALRGWKKSHERLLQAINVLRPRVSWRFVAPAKET